MVTLTKLDMHILPMAHITVTLMRITGNEDHQLTRHILPDISEVEEEVQRVMVDERSLLPL